MQDTAFFNMNYEVEIETMKTLNFQMFTYFTVLWLEHLNFI